jgi:Mn-dependent DtxR family transcriptional regulator
MSEGRWLQLVTRYPHGAALARHVRDGVAFEALRRLERRGLVRRRGDEYRLTRSGRSELSAARAVARLLVRSASRPR